MRASEISSSPKRPALLAFVRGSAQALPFLLAVPNDTHDIVLIDFQMVSVGCGMLDFAFFVSQSLTVESRSMNFEALLTIYLAELAAHGVQFSREDALDKYKRALVFGLAWPVSLSGSLAQLDDRGKALAYAMLDRFVRAVMDSGAHLLHA